MDELAAEIKRLSDERAKAHRFNPDEYDLLRCSCWPWKEEYCEHCGNSGWFWERKREGTIEVKHGE